MNQQPEPIADWISQAELEEIKDTWFDSGFLAGALIGIAVGVSVAYLVLRWVS